MKTELANLIIQLRYDRIKNNTPKKPNNFDANISFLGIKNLQETTQKMNCISKARY